MAKISDTVLIFSEGVVRLDNRKNLDRFFQEVKAHKCRTVFLPDNPDEFYDDVETIIIPLGFPAILNKSYLLDGKDQPISKLISPVSLEEASHIKEVKIQGGVVISGNEKEFQDFTGDFHFILVDGDKEAGWNGEYTTVSSLAEIFPAIKNFDERL